MVMIHVVHLHSPIYATEYIIIIMALGIHVLTAYTSHQCAKTVNNNNNKHLRYGYVNITIFE
jgi:hypothetical protein